MRPFSCYPNRSMDSTGLRPKTFVARLGTSVQELVLVCVPLSSHIPNRKALPNPTKRLPSPSLPHLDTSQLNVSVRISTFLFKTVDFFFFFYVFVLFIRTDLYLHVAFRLRTLKLKTFTTRASTQLINKDLYLPQSLDLCFDLSMEDVDVNFELVWWIALLWISIWPCFTDWNFFFSLLCS